MNIDTYLIESHAEPRSVVAFTHDPREARRFQASSTPDGEDRVQVYLLTEFGEGGYEKHPIRPEVLERHILISDLQDTAKEAQAVMQGIERHLKGQDFEALLLLHTGCTFRSFEGLRFLQSTNEGLNVQYAAPGLPFTITVSGPDGQMPSTDGDFWVCLNLPEHTYPTFWCVQGKWQETPETAIKGEGETLVNS